MGCKNRALADGDRAAHDALDVERFQRSTGADDVDDGIDRPDLMELDVVSRGAVHFSFHLGQQAEGSLGAVTNALGQICGVDQFADRPVAAVVIMRVIMIVPVGENHNVSLRRGHSAAHHVLERQGVAVEVEAADELTDHQRVGTRIDQCRHRHVTCRTGEAVEPGGSGHCIILAIAHAAPNPLSIPTTVTPLAHEACIASRAVIPSRLAP